MGTKNEPKNKRGTNPESQSNLLPGGHHAASAEKMRLDGLRRGHFKGETFISQVQKVPDPEIRLTLLKKARREGWVKSADLAAVIDLIEALESGTSQPVPPEGSHTIMNPGTQRWLEEQKTKPQPEDITPKAISAPWLEERDALVWEQETPTPKPVPPTAEEKAAAELKRREAQVRQILEETACLDADSFKSYRTARRELNSICYELPSGKRIYAEGNPFSDDPYILQQSTIVKVRPAPAANMVLIEDAILRWVEKSAAAKPAMPEEEPEAPPSEHLSLCERQAREASRGMEKWDLPMPAPRADRHGAARHDREYAPITVPIEERPGYGTTIKYRYKN